MNRSFEPAEISILEPGPPPKCLNPLAREWADAVNDAALAEEKVRRAESDLARALKSKDRVQAELMKTVNEHQPQRCFSTAIGILVLVEHGRGVLRIEIE